MSLVSLHLFTLLFPFSLILFPFLLSAPFALDFLSFHFIWFYYFSYSFLFYIISVIYWFLFIRFISVLYCSSFFIVMCFVIFVHNSFFVYYFFNFAILFLLFALFIIIYLLFIIIICVLTFFLWPPNNISHPLFKCWFVCSPHHSSIDIGRWLIIWVWEHRDHWYNYWFHT